MSEVTTLHDLNVRPMTWVTSEYNQRPHAGISAQTPLSVFEEDAERVRFVENPRKLESAFEASLERTVKNDAMCRLRGRTYEVPPHLRRRKIKVHTKLLRPEVVWIEDGGVQVPLHEVDPVANAKRSRNRAAPESKSPEPRTSPNAIENLLSRTLRPGEENTQDNETLGTRYHEYFGAAVPQPACLPTYASTSRLPEPLQGPATGRADSPLAGRVSHPLDDVQGFMERSHRFNPPWPALPGRNRYRLPFPLPRPVPVYRRFFPSP